MSNPILSGTVRGRSSSECLYAYEHTPQPEGYLAWHEWAEKMLKTHSQHRCKHCGLFVIWKPLKRGRKP